MSPFLRAVPLGARLSSLLFCHLPEVSTLNFLIRLGGILLNQRRNFLDFLRTFLFSCGCLMGSPSNFSPSPVTLTLLSLPESITWVSI